MFAHTFNPSDVELMKCLDAKITKKNDEAAENDIDEIDLCSHEPEDIPGLTRISSTHTWHMISPLNRKNSPRRLIKRSTRRGFWRVTGKDTEVKDHQGNKVGSKKYLTFYVNEGNGSTSAKPKRTGWVIHELHSAIQHPNKDNYVLCKLMKKPIAPSPSSNDGVPSPPVAAATNPIISHQTQNETNLTEIFCDGLDDISNYIQSPDFAQLCRDFEEMPTDMIMNWNSGS